MSAGKIAVLRRVARFGRDESGVALVEFALVLPMMLLVFAVIIEGSRMMLSYQSTIVGIRDAARYLARTVAPDICTTGGSVGGYSAKLKTLVVQGVTAYSVFPSDVVIGSVTPSYRCVTGSFRASPVAIAQVTAEVTISFPFAGIFTLVGGSRPNMTTHVTDQARVFGS
ncbi:MAG: TadE/TadG family type IV pilus assembly protein [Cypionkella sp.]